MTEVTGETEVVGGGDGDPTACMSAIWGGDEVKVIEPQERDAGVPTENKHLFFKRN